jgi:hypothetical protein
MKEWNIQILKGFHVEHKLCTDLIYYLILYKRILKYISRVDMLISFVLRS